MLTSFLAAYVLPVLHVVRASEAGGEEGGFYWTAVFIGVAVLVLFVGMVAAVLAIGRGKGSL
ncbi:hypothetical protein KLP28_03750 [Nocardioidaceae bacterium]|nr:hypothetical protein KLP28_03750 [Nocardioidaceae bacterium]